MTKIILTIAMFVAPTVVFFGVSGCEKKTVTVQQTEQKHESEPQMKSPGQEVVE